ncbi:hypothetical protein N657DRAFT_636621 [Parathielavia appendiculata]|uniref:Uncharacterized protein n=1 Tax=Parathielavia appendiculata TaxID=2587402 RepID=A0AAN6YZV9_9PEZI|nr:hypothetical protein N657DRAFT_636621 [Parathielavia appendiculata]
MSPTSWKRATKKQAPRTTRFMIPAPRYRRSIHPTASNSLTESNADIISSVLPSPEHGGRLFIESPTSQFRGAGVHISAPSMLPTVERETIDLTSNGVWQWNTRTLRTAGIIAVASHRGAMLDMDIESKGHSQPVSQGNELTKRINSEAFQILRTHTFAILTLNGREAATLISKEFWRALREAQSIPVYSKLEVLPMSKVWDDLTAGKRQQVVHMLQHVPSVPTRLGANHHVIASNVERDFPSALGLRQHPSVDELVDRMADPDDARLRDNAMSYFIKYFDSQGYAPLQPDRINKRILPVKGKDSVLVQPSSCCTEKVGTSLGYSILWKRLHSHAYKFGDPPFPPIPECVDKLVLGQRRSLDRQTAVIMFEHSTNCQCELSKSQVSDLRNTPLVPVERRRQPSSQEVESGPAVIRHMCPADCYRGPLSDYALIFDYVRRFKYVEEGNSWVEVSGILPETKLWEEWKTRVLAEDGIEPKRLYSIIMDANWKTGKEAELKGEGSDKKAPGL